MLADKDIYCEKPLTLTIAEGELIRKVQNETGRVVQVGTQQRSQFNLFTKAIAIVADGRLIVIEAGGLAVAAHAMSDGQLLWRRQLPRPPRGAQLLQRLGPGRLLHRGDDGLMVLASADGSLLARANRVGREEILVCDVPLVR